MSKIHQNKRLQTFIIRLSQIFVVSLYHKINPKKNKVMKTLNLDFTAEEEKEIEKRFQNADVISKLTNFLKRDDIYMYLSAEDEFMLMNVLMHLYYKANKNLSI